MVTERRRGVGQLVGPVCVAGCLIALLLLGACRLTGMFEEWFQLTRQIKLAQAEKACRARQERRKKMIWALIDRRITLPEAATVCRSIRAEVTVIKALVPERYQGYSDEEQECLFTIDIVCDELLYQPSMAKTVRARLEAELQELRKCGPIRLPPAPAIAEKKGAS